MGGLAAIGGLLGSALGTGLSIVKSRKQKKEQERIAQQQQAQFARTQEEIRKKDEDLPARPGRLQLIATTPRGILSETPVGRRKILGN